ncbi:hypothetical protein CK203_112327 [Vitis vinifera]|uniref:Uncharacterized protein n=1 Tax=Vitis vinifera TaxID=29760 RepID=A0A438CBW6_VITVI|nr:hypothetical protein CK203_112327 [Vitis vinifera]
MQALIRNTSKLRALITNQALVLRSNALFSSSAFPGSRDFEMGRNSRSMNFVRGIIEQDRRNIPGSAQFPRGIRKLGLPSGCLSEMKGGPKLSRYAADATAEHVGRLARNLGLKSVVNEGEGVHLFQEEKTSNNELEGGLQLFSRR